MARALAKLQALLAPFALVSCATTVTLPPLPECHPANAAAPAAERERPSGILDLAAPAPSAEPAPEEPEEMEGHEHHHEPPPPPPAGGER